MKESFGTLKFLLVGLRKFIAWSIYLAVAIVLLLTGIIPGEDWLGHITTGTVAFFSTNIGEHLINLGKDWIKNKKFEDVAKIINRNDV